MSFKAFSFFGLEGREYPGRLHSTKLHSQTILCKEGLAFLGGFFELYPVIEVPSGYFGDGVNNFVILARYVFDVYSPLLRCPRFAGIYCILHRFTNTNRITYPIHNVLCISFEANTPKPHPSRVHVHWIDFRIAQLSASTLLLTLAMQLNPAIHEPLVSLIMHPHPAILLLELKQASVLTTTQPAWRNSRCFCWGYHRGFCLVP